MLQALGMGCGSLSSQRNGQTKGFLLWKEVPSTPLCKHVSLETSGHTQCWVSWGAAGKETSPQGSPPRAFCSGGWGETRPETFRL